MNKLFCLGLDCLLNKPKTKTQAWVIYKQTNINKLFFKPSPTCLGINGGMKVKNNNNNNNNKSEYMDFRVWDISSKIFLDTLEVSLLVSTIAKFSLIILLLSK